MTPSELKRLKALEEKARLKRIVAPQALGIELLKEKMVLARRSVVKYLRKAGKCSECGRV